jgi:hypothetical protein
MWSKRPTVYVCPLIQRALALVLAEQSFSTAAATLSAYNKQIQPSNAWAPCRNLSPVRVQANPSASGLQDDPARRPLCVL